MASTSRPTTNTNISSSKQKQLEDINMKMKIAKNILDGCEKDKQRQLLQGARFPLGDEMRRFAGYVGDRYKSLFDDYDIKRQSLRKRTLGVMESNESNNNYTHEIFRKVVFNIYVTRRSLPSKSLLLQEMNKYSLSEVLKLNLSQSLLLGGFVWTPLPNLGKCILVERPELVAARFEYLKQIFKYRSENRPIVYLEEGNYKIFNVSYKLSQKSVFAVAATEKGIIEVDFLPALCGDQDNFLETFVERIGHLLPSRCVLVLNERPHHVRKAVPNENSTRKDMIDWLKDCKIPFQDTMHSGELFALILRFKTKFPPVKYKLEDVAKQFDAEVLYKPYLMVLNFFKNVNQITSRQAKRTKAMLAGLKTESIDWNSNEEELIATERKLFEEDMKMEVIIDQLMTMATDGKICPEDVKQLPDLKYERTDHIGTDVVIF